MYGSRCVLQPSFGADYLQCLTDELPLQIYSLTHKLVHQRLAQGPTQVPAGRGNHNHKRFQSQLYTRSCYFCHEVVSQGAADNTLLHLKSLTRCNNLAQRDMSQQRHPCNACTVQTPAPPSRLSHCWLGYAC